MWCSAKQLCLSALGPAVLGGITWNMGDGQIKVIGIKDSGVTLVNVGDAYISHILEVIMKQIGWYYTTIAGL